MFDAGNFGNLLKRIQLLYDGKNGRTYFYVMVGQSQVSVHFAVIGVRVFSTGFRTVLIYWASIVVAEEWTWYTFYCIKSIGVDF